MLPESDLKVTAIRQGTAGGQQAGLTRYTVRVEHLPTGIAAESGTERSQLHNRRIAMEMVEYGLMAAGLTTPANKTDGE